MSTGENTLKSFFRKRAERACDFCKIAKVRCSALEEMPCSNCMLKGVKCIIDERSRRRFRPRTRRRFPNLLPYGESFPRCIISNTQPLEITPQSLGSSEEPAVLAAKTDPDQDGFQSEWRKGTFSSTCLQSPSPYMIQFPQYFQRVFWETFTNLSTPEPSPSEKSGWVAPLPGFIRPFPTRVNRGSLEYLQIHGALTLPSIPLQKALLQTFIECVLPCAPILQWPSFVNITNARDGSQGHISLLLFHAVMFSATTSVGLKHLLQAGYSSRREAQEAFFQRTKLLYQSDYESDALTIVQALLLMTYRSDAADVDDSKHWSEVAISIAQPIGLFQDQSSSENSLYCPKLWRRIGWTCYMTDCLISLRLRCVPSIKSENFRHQMLTVGDFELYKPLSENQILDPEYTLIHRVKAQRDLALLCISRARLCVCITGVLEIQGKSDQFHSSIAILTTTINERNGSDFVTKAITSDRALTNWMNSLPPSCQYHPLALGDINDRKSTLFVQRSLLHMVYHTLISVLHESQKFPSSSFRVHHAARQITKIASELHKRSLHNCLSVIGVTAILVAMNTHISEMKSLPSLEREEAMEDFQSCMAVMASLQDVYSEAKTLTAWMFQEMEKVAMDGGSGRQHDGNSPFSDLTVSPCRQQLTFRI